MTIPTQATLETLNNDLKTSQPEITEETLEVIRGGLHIIVHPDLQNLVVFG